MRERFGRLPGKGLAMQLMCLPEVCSPSELISSLRMLATRAGAYRPQPRYDGQCAKGGLDYSLVDVARCCGALEL